MCDPLPRTINSGSPPTERNARTGEFTPPGIMLSARCCRRRDCSVLRDVVDGIESSRQEMKRKRMSQIEPTQTNTIAAPANRNSSDIHAFAILLQHAGRTLRSSSYPSNREGFEGQSRGLRTVLFLLLAADSKAQETLSQVVLSRLNLDSTTPSRANRATQFRPNELDW